jgi:hypothetical protein
MNDLIKAFQIFLKYGNPSRPTHCEHDTLWILIDPVLVSDVDINELNALGFIAQEDHFISYKFGSA